jgi:hypothetical protein
MVAGTLADDVRLAANRGESAAGLRNAKAAAQFIRAHRHRYAPLKPGPADAVIAARGGARCNGRAADLGVRLYS